MEDTVQEVCAATNEVLDAKLNEIYAVLDDIGELLHIEYNYVPYIILLFCSKTRRGTSKFQISIF